MRRFSRHVLAPLLASVGIVALYFTPKEAIGCANRGLAALGIATVALVIGLVLAITAVAQRSSRPKESAWFALSAALLSIPTLLLLGPLG